MHAEWRVLHVVCAHGVLNAACYASLQMQAERRALLTQKKRRVRHLKEAAAALMAERANLGNEMDRSESDAHTIATVRWRVPTALGNIRTVAGVQVAHVGAGMLHRARKSIMEKQSMAAKIQVEDSIHVPGAVPVPPTPRQEKAQGHARDQSKVGGCLATNPQPPCAGFAASDRRACRVRVPERRMRTPRKPTTALSGVMVRCMRGR